ncbi:MAG: DUF420 domain-containing protein [Rhodospirillales bacterium]|nr:DUF420 domain-containing protein [Rhodospirillales bacterium]
MEITQLPHILAGLNGLTAIFLVAGFVFIRRKNRAAHRACMLGAVTLAGVFMIVYVTYHANSGLAKFGGVGLIRPVYFTILIAHIIGAVALVPMVPMTLFRALKGRFGQHKRLARWTWPLWLYVSASGVVVYVMAIHIYPYG